MELNGIDLAILIGAALSASLISAITGGGVTVILLPVLVLHFGIQVAIPIVTIALMAASASRVAVNRSEIAVPVAAWFSLGSLPFTMAGAYLFTISAPDFLTRLLGGFLLAAALLRRLRPSPSAQFAASWFLPMGAVFGFLTGISAAVGAVLAPFFLAFGLRKGAYVGTMGLNTFAIQLTKLAVFGSRDFLRPEVLTYGGLLIPFMVLGTILGKRILVGFSDKIFVMMIEVVMVIAGLNFLIRGAV